MNVQNVISRVSQISDAAVHDNEKAHAMEDQLYIDVLKAIANGAHNAQDLAMEAIKADTIEFDRWCA